MTVKTRLLPIYLILSITAIAMVAPLVLTVFTALKAPAQIVGHPWMPPWPPVLDNLTMAWTEGRFNVYFRNSLFISTIDSLLMIPISAMAAYALVFIRFPGRRVLLGLFVIGLIVPATAIIIPLYVTVAGLGLVNTHLGVILADVALALPVFIFLMVSFFVNLPRELHDAARVDGARELRIFWSVILPLSKPAVVTVALLEFLWSWNDLLLRLVFLTRDPLRTMTVGLLFYQGQQTRNVAGITAAAVIMGVPIIILFLIFQRQFVQGLTKGAVK